MRYKKEKRYLMTATQNHKMMEKIICFLQKTDMFTMVNIYTNGHHYSSDNYPEKEDTIVCKTKYGEYYDMGECDVEKIVEYANKDTITMTFEGPLYYDYNGYSEHSHHSYDKLNQIAEPYGLYAEQGYAWSLAFYK